MTTDESTDLLNLASALMAIAFVERVRDWPRRGFQFVGLNFCTRLPRFSATYTFPFESTAIPCG